MKGRRAPHDTYAQRATEQAFYISMLPKKSSVGMTVTVAHAHSALKDARQLCEIRKMLQS